MRKHTRMPLLTLARLSLWNRRGTALLTALSIAISVALLLSVRQLGNETRNSFTNTISGTDLIVGARSGPLNLLLYAVFHLGDATNNISYSIYEKLVNNREVAWAIPLSLGDSHHGFRVVGTSQDFFTRYRYARDVSLRFSSGQAMNDLYDTVLGAEVARSLGYQTGDRIIVAHGTGNVSFTQHDDKPFTVAGVLAATGTPIDRAIYVSLEAIEAIHIDWQGGVPARGNTRVSADAARQLDLSPKTVTAVLVGLNSKLATFAMQRAINEYRGEPLLAILPGVTLTQLWSMLGVVERMLMIVSALVALAGLIGMLTTVMASLNERRREMAILRSVGARPPHVFALLISEAGLLALAGIALGLAFYAALLATLSPVLRDRYGLSIQAGLPDAAAWSWLGAMLLASIIISLFPAWRAYRRSLADGLSVRI